MEQNTSQSTDPITPYAPSGVVQDYSNSPYGHDGQLRHSGFAKTSFWVSLISLGLMAVGLIVTMVIIFSAFPAVSSGSRNAQEMTEAMSGSMVLLMVSGLLYILGAVGSLVGLILNIICLSSKGKTKKILPTIGVVMSGLVIGLFLLGIVINVFTRA